jgi:hypothetical protein
MKLDIHNNKSHFRDTLLPESTDAIDIGSADNRWRTVNAKNITVSSLTSLTFSATSIVVGTATGSTIAGNFLSAASAAAVVGQATAWYGGQFFNVTDQGSDLANANAIGLVAQSAYSNAGYFQQGAISGLGSTLARNNIYPALYATRVIGSLNGFDFTAPVFRIDETTAATGGLMDVKRSGGAAVFVMDSNGAIVITNAGTGASLTLDRGIKFNTAINQTQTGPSLANSSNTLRISSGTTGVTFVSQDQGTALGNVTNAGFWGLGTAATTTAFLTLPLATTAASSVRLPHGSAPTSPVNGDMWTTSSGLFVRINGATVGPLS